MLGTEYCGSRPRYESLPSDVISAKAAPSDCPMARNSRPLGDVQPQEDEPSPPLLPSASWLRKW